MTVLAVQGYCRSVGLIVHMSLENQENLDKFFLYGQGKPEKPGKVRKSPLSCSNYWDTQNVQQRNVFIGRGSLQIAKSRKQIRIDFPKP